ncbi:uncharacterized protein RHO25_001679 [Cercospora beticola]|uniref:CXC domain-containing protein n=1 Tax=Cercospora beticola TaxID=122368 RepID=A0ABZ0NC06_CERBT|nr:hypothetical protein RHO25_001679 [Cercospora beticola]
MARILTFLLAITFALAVLASSSPSCSNGHYTPLLALIGNDAKTRTFCASLPPRSRFKQNQCPSALRRLAYQEIKEFCACFHATCKAPRCRGVTPDCCDKYPCGKLCTNKQTSNEHCGKCNRKCGSYQKCHIRDHLIYDHLIDNHLIDNHLIDNHIIDDHIIDNHIIDDHIIIDHYVLDNHIEYCSSLLRNRGARGTLSQWCNGMRQRRFRLHTRTHQRSQWIAELQGQLRH